MYFFYFSLENLARIVCVCVCVFNSLLPDPAELKKIKLQKCIIMQLLWVYIPQKQRTIVSKTKPNKPLLKKKKEKN